MNNSETSLIIEMLRGIKETQIIHGSKIDNIKDLSEKRSCVRKLKFRKRTYWEKQTQACFSGDELPALQSD